MRGSLLPARFRPILVLLETASAGKVNVAVGSILVPPALTVPPEEPIVSVSVVANVAVSSRDTVLAAVCAVPAKS